MTEATSEYLNQPKRTEMEARVAKLIREGRFGVADSAEINGGTKLADLGLDSLDAVVLTIDAESEFGIAIDAEAALSLHTVSDVADAINAALREGGEG